MKLKVTYEVEYDFSDPELWQEYTDWLDDYADTRQNRKWFVEDRAVGSDWDNRLDPAGKVRIA